MINIELKKPNVRQIIKKIEEEAAARKAEGPRFYRQGTPNRNTVNSVTRETVLFHVIKIIQGKIRKYPFYNFIYNTAYKFRSIIPQYHECIRFEDLQKYHDEEFIVNAYRGILKRLPDKSGFDNYLLTLQKGRLTKTEIMGRLRYSSEGKIKRIKIKGLLLRYIIQTSYRIPIIGYVLMLIMSIVRLPMILRGIQEYEAFFNARFTHQTANADRLASDIHKLFVDVHKTSLELIKTSTTLDNTIHEVGKISVDAQRISSEIVKLSSDLKSNIAFLVEHKADSQTIAEIEKRVQDQQINMLELQNSLRLLFDETKKRLIGMRSADQMGNIVREEEHLLDALYVAFEDRFRGKKEDIKEHAKVYLPYIEKAKAKTNGTLVLDIGCGRGEWLELLKENGYQARGIDTNRVMVRMCGEAGFNVIEADGMHYLKQQSPDSFSAITGLHIVEHLPYTDLIRILDEAFRTLKPGGVVIFETPNAETLIVGARNFYLDPTHRNPILPETLKFLLEARGFVVEEILRFHPVTIEIDDKYLQDLLFGPQDYGIIGAKP